MKTHISIVAAFIMMFCATAVFGQSEKVALPFWVYFGDYYNFPAGITYDTHNIYAKATWYYGNTEAGDTEDQSTVCCQVIPGYPDGIIWENVTKVRVEIAFISKACKYISRRAIMDFPKGTGGVIVPESFINPVWICTDGNCGDPQPQ